MDDKTQENNGFQQATLGGGCFWCLEAVFEQVRGVRRVVSGYAGGKRPNPSYEQVCTGATGHAEVVQVEYDPAQVTYDELLKVFWENHDPTTLNRQGPDFGSQYRSVVFYHTPEQKAAAEAFKENLQRSGRFGKPIVTAIAPALDFWRGEEYHQRYLEKHGRSHCQL